MGGGQDHHAVEDVTLDGAIGRGGDPTRIEITGMGGKQGERRLAEWRGGRFAKEGANRPAQGLGVGLVEPSGMDWRTDILVQTRLHPVSCPIE